MEEKRSLSLVAWGGKMLHLVKSGDKTAAKLNRIVSNDIRPRSRKRVYRRPPCQS